MEVFAQFTATMRFGPVGQLTLFIFLIKTDNQKPLWALKKAANCLRRHSTLGTAIAKSYTEQLERVFSVQEELLSAMQTYGWNSRR